MLGFEHLLDFGELGSSFEKSGDTFELLEVERDLGEDFAVYAFGISVRVSREEYATGHLGKRATFLGTNGMVTPST